MGNRANRYRQQARKASEAAARERATEQHNLMTATLRELAGPPPETDSEASQESESE